MLKLFGYDLNLSQILKIAYKDYFDSFEIYLLIFFLFILILALFSFLMLFKKIREYSLKNIKK